MFTKLISTNVILNFSVIKTGFNLHYKEENSQMVNEFY